MTRWINCINSRTLLVRQIFRPRDWVFFQLTTSDNNQQLPFRPPCDAMRHGHRSGSSQICRRSCLEPSPTTIPIPRPREVVQPVRNAGYALNDVKEIIARKNKQEEKAGNQVWFPGFFPGYNFLDDVKTFKGNMITWCSHTCWASQKWLRCVFFFWWILSETDSLGPR